MRSRLALLIIAGIAVLSCGCSDGDPNAHETSGEKAEWSALQTIEWRNRETVLKEPVIERVDGYNLLGVRGRNGANVWILLNPVAPPFYKQLPHDNYTVPNSLVEKLIRDRTVGYTTEEVLRSRIEGH